MKILDARPSRGKMRVSFVCGMRALRDYQQKFLSAQAAAALLSTGVEELPQGGGARPGAAAPGPAGAEAGPSWTGPWTGAAQLTQEAAGAAGGGRAVVSCVLAGLDRDGLREVAGYLTGQGVAALLAGEEGPGAPLVFAAPAQLGLSMGQLLSQVLKPLGGKGGRPGRFRPRAAGPGPGRPGGRHGPAVPARKPPGRWSLINAFEDRFDAVIFDMDGTLLDSMPYWRRINYDFLAQRGWSLPRRSGPT